MFTPHLAPEFVRVCGGKGFACFSMAPTSTMMIVVSRQSSVLAAAVSPRLLRTPLAVATTLSNFNCRFTSSLLTPTTTYVPLFSPSSLWRNHTFPSFVQPGNSLLYKSLLPFYNSRNYSSLVSNRITAMMPFQHHQQPTLTMLQQSQPQLQQQQQQKKDITVRYMNRNARKAKRANHGKRPCSRIRRRYKTKKWANTCRKG